MNSLMIADVGIHQDEQGRYSLNDLQKAAIANGIKKDIRPNEWLSTQPTKELIEVLITENRGNKPLNTRAGRYGGTYVCKELVYSYAMWIDAKFHLKVIQTFDAVVTGKYSNKNVISIETRLPVVADDFVAAKKIAEIMGLVGNQAVLSANVMTKKTTGVDVMELAEVKYLVNEEQELTHTPTDLGSKFGMSAIEINKLLCGCGLQKSIDYKKGKKRWELTEQGREFGKYLDSGRKHSDGTPVMSIGWFETVLNELVKYGEKLKAGLPMSVVSGFK